MPENIIQPIDKYVADKLYEGVLTPKITESVNTNPTSYDHFLSKMYTEKYTRSYENFDKFKDAYQSQYGDPFKKKEPSVLAPKAPSAATFQPEETRIQKPVTEIMQERSSQQDQEEPLGTYVEPSKGTYAATFQPSETRQQLPVEDIQSSNAELKQQEQDAIRSDMYSIGLITTATDIQKKQLAESTAQRYANHLDATDPASMQDNSQASESTGINKPMESLADKGRGQAQYDALQNAVDYTKIAGRQITDVVPGLWDARNLMMQYAYEKATGNPGVYTKEQRDDAYQNGGLAYKTFAVLSGDRLTSAYDEFSDNYLTGSKYAEESEGAAYASAAGQLASMLIGGTLVKSGASTATIAVNAAKSASALNTVKLGVNAAGKIITSTAKSPSTYVAGQQIFNSTFQEAYQATGDSDKAMAAAAINTVISSGLEALPILNFTARLDKQTGGAIKKVLSNGIVGGLEEAITEGLQGVVENTVAANIYDETRNITDGLSKQIEVGGVTGFAMNVILTALHVKLRNTTDPYERQEIERSIQDTSVKQLEVQKQEVLLENSIENAAVVKTNEKVQEVLSTPNIGTEQIAEATQIRKEMPNEETVEYKTVGMTNRINELMVEKNTLYDKVTGGPSVVEQTKIADARALAIDQEIRKISNDIAEVYAAPSKQIIDQETASEIDGSTVENKAPAGSAVDAEVSGVPETSTSQNIQEQLSEQATGNVYHGGSVVDLNSISENEPFFITESESEAIAYAKGNKGHVSIAKIDLSKIAKEEVARKILEGMGFQDEYMLHELVDPRFEENYIGEGNVKQLYSELEKQGYEGVEFTDSGIAKQKHVTNILLIQPKKTLEKSDIGKNIIVRENGASDLLGKGYFPVIDGKVVENANDEDLENHFRKNETVKMVKPNTKEQIKPEKPKQPTNETAITTNKEAEVSSTKTVAPKIEEQKRKVAGKGRTPLDKRNVNNPDILAALTHEVSDVEDIALQAFVQGEISPTKEVYNELYKNSTGDKKAAIGIIRTPEKGGKTLDEMAHKLWENQPNSDQYSTSDFKNAIENVILTNISKKSAALKLNEKFGAPIEEGGKRVDSSGNELFETPNGWLTQDAIDDIIVAEDFKKSVSQDDYNQVLEEYDNLSDEEFNKLFEESQAEAKPVKIADKSEIIREIKEKNLTHVQGVAMGSGVAKGTYLSTEKGNRYQGRGKKFNAEVSVENPYTTSEDNLNKERGDVLKNSIDQFSEMDFEGAEVPTNPTIDDLSNSGTEKLADLFTKNLQVQGYDSMYFPESKTQEGELVVFDKGKVTLTEDSEVERDAVNLTQGEFEEKHPGENYETIRQYAFKDTEVAMEANKKSENPDNLVMYANGFNIPFTIGNIPKKIKASWIKTFQKGAGIPYQFVYEISVKRKSTIDRRTEELNKLVKNIHKNILKKINEDIDQKIKDNPKEKSALNLSRPKYNVIPDNIALELNDRFAGRKTSELLPDTILLEIDTARNAVISLQKEMVAAELLDTDIHLGRNEKGEYYVNRTYRKFDDKGWKDKIPQKIMNKALLVLRDLYNQRDTNVQSLAGKMESRIKSAQQKIEERITNLDGKKLQVSNAIRSIDKKISKYSKDSNVPTQDIDVLQQKKKNLLTRIAKLESDTKEKNKKAEYAIKKAKKGLENFLRDNKGNTEIDIDGYIERDIQRFITSDPDAYSGNASAESARVVSSIFKTKSEFLTDNQALRDVMGEVNDPFINILNTAHKMVTTIENYKSQKRMKDMGMNVLFSTKPSKKFNTELKADGMPGLTEDGQLYTTPEFAESFRIMESSAPQVTSELLKTIGNGLGWIKMGKTVMSTPAAINNYVSNVKHIATNGWNPYYALKNYATLSKTQKEADVKDLFDRGVLSQSITGRELQDRKKALIGGFSIKETVSRVPILDVGAKVVGALSDFHAKVFANGDNYAKYIGFYTELNALRDIYPKWSEDQLRNEAAIIVSKISPTFDMVSPGVEKIRRSNLFSTFATFPAEQIRNRYNVGLLIKEDFKSGDKERIKRGIRRLSGQLVGVGLSAALLSLSKYFIGIGYEELKDLQIFQSEYSKNNAIVYLNRNGDELEYMDVSRTDYDSYLLVAPLIAYITDEYNEEQFENSLIRSAQAISSPFTDTNILTETMADVIYGRKLDNGDAIFSDNDNFAEKLRKSTKHALSKLEPTNVKIGRTWYDLADTGKDEYGGTITPRTAIIKTVGFGGRTLNVTKQFAYHFYTIKAQNDDDKNKFERSYNNTRTDEEKEKATQRYVQQLTIGISKMAHLSRVAQQNSGNMQNITDLINKLPKELRYSVAYGEIPEYKDKSIIQKGVDAYVQKTVENLTKKVKL